MKRLLIVFAVLVAIAIGSALLGVLISSSGKPAALCGNEVLRFTVAGDLREQAPSSGLRLPGFSTPTSYAAIYTALLAARTDPTVKGLRLDIQDASFGLAKAQELRELFAALKKSGKFVRCYMDSAGEGSNGTLEYYLASACSHISLAPPGEVNLIGLYVDSAFLRGALEKLKIDATYAHAGKYKSAPEAFTEYGFSPAAREAMDTLLDSEFSQIVRGIAADRGISEDTVRSLVDRAPFDAKTALDAKLVDALAYPDEFQAAIEEAAGGDVRYVDLEEYRRSTSTSGHHVAVVFAAGTIVRGSGGEQPWSQESFVGADDLSRTLAEVADDDDVSAVVLRIDSPGGSALASDLIQREVARLRDRKPVVVSMSDLAASGGYYIAARAQKIVALPATLTGSIGVFAGKFSSRRFQQDWLGISHDTLKRGANADYYSALDPFNDDQNGRFTSGVERTYDRFVGVVSAGRKMSRDAVDAVAQGRVWTGEDALRAGLVDELGGLERAVALAGELAGLPNGTSPELEFLPAAPTLLETLFGHRPTAASLSLDQILHALAPRAAQALELPPEISRLSRPF